MEQFVARGRASVGDVDFDYGIRDLQVFSENGNIAVYASSGSYGGMTGYRINSQGNLTQTDTQAYNPTSSAGLATDMVMVDTSAGMRMLVGGTGAGRVMSYDITTGGQISGTQVQSGVSSGMGVLGSGVAVGNMVMLANPWDEGFSCYSLSGQQMTLVDTVSDTGDSYGYAIRDMVVLRSGGTDFVVTGAQGSTPSGWSLSEAGITSYELGSNRAIQRDALGAEDGLGMTTPTDMTVAHQGGQQYAIVASAAGNEGSLSVIGISASGGLDLVDHVGDTRDTRFGAAQAVEAITAAGRTYVVAGGGDDGLSLFTLAPGGRLVLIDSFADTGATGLSGITAIELAVQGGNLHVFAASQSDAGVTHLTIDLADVGQTRASNAASTAGGTEDDLIAGGSGNNDISGGAGDDILIDGQGRDTLQGGSGADLFVMVADEDDDAITGFNVFQDQIDLSGWENFHSADALSLSRISGGIKVTWREEELDVTSGSWMSYDDFRAAIVRGTTRVFETPSVELTGGSGADVLTGNWAADTLSGGGGNDILRGGEGGDILSGGTGDDTIEGGGGEDRAIMGGSQRDVTDVEVMGGGRVQITSLTGVDVYQDVELFQFTDGLLDLTQTIDLQRGLTLTGSGGNDAIAGGGGHDTIRGGDGRDALSGRAGDDVLDGGAGHDTIEGGMGLDRAVMGFEVDGQYVVHVLDDDRVQVVSNQGTDIFDGVERFEFSDDVLSFGELGARASGRIIDGTSGQDSILGTTGDDLIEGRQGADVIIGKGGNDVIRGGGGGDLLNGRMGEDTLQGGAGNDTLKGGGGVDQANIAARLKDVSVRMLSPDRMEIRSADGVDILEEIEWVSFQDAYLRWSQLKALQKNPAYFGTWGADNIEGNNAGNLMMGYGGNDRLQGNSGNDSINGGSGHDTLGGARGNDTIEGGTGNDVIYGDTGTDRAVLDVRRADATVRDLGKGWVEIRSADGVDRYHGVETFQFTDRTVSKYELLTQKPGIVRNGTEGRDTLMGTDNNDTLIGEGGQDLISGKGGRDTLRGGNGDDRIYGGAGNDSMTGSRGSDEMKGGDGADTMDGGFGSDRIEGGTGNDRISGGDGHDLINGQGGSDRANGGAGRDTLKGEAGNDTLYGGDDDDAVFGHAGNDLLIGQNGNDRLGGGDGHDVLKGGGQHDEILGGAGNDRATGGTGSDTMLGGSGNDRLYGEDGQDVIQGGAGHDWLVGQDGGDLMRGDAGNDRLKGGGQDDRLYGGTGQDTLEGGTGHDLILGERDNDRVLGGSGSDTIKGAHGNDTLSGETGNDIIYGGAGNDWLGGQDGADRLFGEAGNDRILGGGRDDLLQGDTGNDTLGGGSGRDTLRGGADRDRLYGDDDGDHLLGGSGDDFLSGGRGYDRLDGGSGRDVLRGGAGNDTLTGGSWGDEFVFHRGEGRDTITDFDTQQDTLFLRADMVGGRSDGWSVLRAYGEVTDEGVVLDFGGGMEITLEGVGGFWSLADDIEIF